ncbi:MAG: hypothetical protein EVA50_04135 [Gammaproteobacteria bacterium]|nr:MAG: hypothetical protein EVA50_04135 [Gammaproteobacteria bacterium]
MLSASFRSANAAGLTSDLKPSASVRLTLYKVLCASPNSSLLGSLTPPVQVTRTTCLVAAGHDMRALKVKANEIAEVMEYTDLQIGQSLGILRQSNLVKG